jgi:hypothetical protein
VATDHATHATCGESSSCFLMFCLHGRCIHADAYGTPKNGIDGCTHLHVDGMCTRLIAAGLHWEMIVARFWLASCVLLMCSGSWASSLPPIRLAEDGFPTGHETPEGVAADLARAFIARDDQLFLDTCLKPFGGGPAREEYEDFLRLTAESMRLETQLSEPSAAGPARIGKVFAARQLSSNGPASYGDAAFNFSDVAFVDVGAFLHDGSPSINRTLVVRLASGRWYVHPVPSISPLLSMGLNEERPSTEDFSDRYSVSGSED